MAKYIEIDGIGEVVPRSEYEALAAQVEALITAEPEWAKLGSILGEKQANAFKLQREQHLAEIRAQAAIKGWRACWEWVDSDDRDKLTLIPAADQYADSIRRGGAK